MLRGFVIGFGILLTTAGAIGLLTGAGPRLLGPLLFGVLLLIGTLLEKRYWPNSASPPGPGWEPTGERFHDPAKGGEVEVWYNKISGQRRYVRSPQ